MPDAAAAIAGLEVRRLPLVATSARRAAVEFDSAKVAPVCPNCAADTHRRDHRLKQVEIELLEPVP